MKVQKSSSSQTILRMKNKAESITFPNFKLHYKVIIIKAIWYWHKETQKPMEQMYIPDINPCTYGQLIFYNGSKNSQWGENSTFNKCCWEK